MISTLSFLKYCEFMKSIKIFCYKLLIFSEIYAIIKVLEKFRLLSKFYGQNQYRSEYFNEE